MITQIKSVKPLRVHPLAAAIICASGALASLPAQAQQTTSSNPPSADVLQLDATSVTGNLAPASGVVSSDKFTAPLLDTPQTVHIIPREVFVQQGAQNLTDVLGNTPGISFNAGENGFATSSNNFQLRGFDTSGSIFVDGVRDSGSQNRDIFNIEQVEVFKGPAADNGRGGPGGYINQVTKTPQLQNFNLASIGYGFDSYDSDNRLRATLDSNYVISDGTAVRVNLLARDGGLAGREHAEQNSFGVAPSISFGLNTPTRFTLAYQYVKHEDVPDWGVPTAFIKGMDNYDSVTRESDRDNFYGLKSDYDDTESYALMARIEHDLSDNITFSNQLRWSQNKREARYTLPSGFTSGVNLVTTQTQLYDRTNVTLSNLSSLVMEFQTGGLEHTLSTGLELSQETSRGDRYATNDAGDTDLFNPDPSRSGSYNPEPTQNNDVNIDTVALYAYDTIKLNEQWQVTGGLRAEHYQVDIDSLNADGTSQGPADGYSLSDTTLGGKLGLVFKPADNGSIYASVGLSTLPPGSYLSNPDISRTGNNAFPGLVGQNNDAAKTQKAVNYEIGTKWELFDERLSATAALFHTERRDVAISGKTPGDPDSPTELKGYGKQIVQGLELGLTGRITPAWDVFGGVVFLESERKHSAFLDAARREANPNDYGTFSTTRGDELAFTPDTSANLWTTYRLPIGLTLGAGARYVSESWLGRPDDADRIIPNGRYGELPDYTVFNAMASYEVNSNIAVRLNIDNITDELYATSSNWSGSRAAIGAPRSYLLTTTVNF
ncbi:MAG TPA: TonB-dependent siderophore receptor [Pseudomonas xinjiangensis]|uniref:TonB-dependent siderophore receptor n=2 Tax=root TaxID=1 RepID=A0A7V1FTE7_9GAMM|nr:TonB-dependent siderophore receptor [Halopseudomonas xinjiangensis]HEC46336.1 TonB-dependent siderophore receptor [Halopseudomonas xinjiangensis]